jgi:2,5-diamino-6-(ribosylamino)-4(3H)-pyrimidinone 5'-phosphate reductase
MKPLEANRRTYNTLFMIESLDGKISAGDVGERDFDADLPKIAGVKEGLHQYYELEKQGDSTSFISARVLAKIGFNEKSLVNVAKIPVNFVIIDNKPHFNEHGVEYMALWTKTLFLVTTNKNHPAYELQKRYDNIVILHHESQIDFDNLFTTLREKYDIPRVTIQSGGELNAVLLRAGLIDAAQIVIAPCLVGGRSVSSLIDGESLRTEGDLTKIRPLKLKDCRKLDDSYVVLDYEVVNQP